MEIGRIMNWISFLFEFVPNMLGRAESDFLVFKRDTEEMV